MKNILDEIENMIINNEESAAQAQGGVNGEKDGDKDATGGVSGINGILNDNAGGGLGTIKDEDSNADSDFSGDEGPSSNSVTQP
jgi:hypothetical protein